MASHLLRELGRLHTECHYGKSTAYDITGALVVFPDRSAALVWELDVACSNHAAPTKPSRKLGSYATSRPAFAGPFGKRTGSNPCRRIRPAACGRDVPRTGRSADVRSAWRASSPRPWAWRREAGCAGS